MKLLAIVLVCSALLLGQSSKYKFTDTPVKDGPFIHLKDEPARLFVYKNRIHALGVWVAVGSSSRPAGPSVSDIYCSAEENTCHEQMANIVVLGDSFSLNPDSADYHITRWTNTEIVAENRDVQGPLLAGECHIMGVLKIDLEHKKIYAYQTLLEPPVPTDKAAEKAFGSSKICEAANNTLWELHDQTMFTTATAAKTVTSQ